MRAVFNSSPIIFLTKLGIIEDALDLFERIDIPSLVYAEILQKPDSSAEAVEAQSTSTTVRHRINSLRHE